MCWKSGECLGEFYPYSCCFKLYPPLRTVQNTALSGTPMRAMPGECSLPFSVRNDSSVLPWTLPSRFQVVYPCRTTTMYFSAGMGCDNRDDVAPAGSMRFSSKHI